MEIHQLVGTRQLESGLSVKRTSGRVRTVSQEDEGSSPDCQSRGPGVESGLSVKRTSGRVRTVSQEDQGSSPDCQSRGPWGRVWTVSQEDQG